MKYISGTIKQQSIGVCHYVQISKPEMIVATCALILKVSKNSEYICNESLYF